MEVTVDLLRLMEDLVLDTPDGESRACRWKEVTRAPWQEVAQQAKPK